MADDNQHIFRMSVKDQLWFDANKDTDFDSIVEHKRKQIEGWKKITGDYEGLTYFTIDIAVTLPGLRDYLKNADVNANDLPFPRDTFLQE
jgi:hypothetical protein